MSMQLDETYHVLNVTFFSENDCVDVVGQNNFTISKYESFEINSTEYFTNISLSFEHPIPLEDISEGWIDIGFYEDENCNDRYSYYGYLGTVIGIELRAIRSDVETRFGMVFTDDYIIQIYGDPEDYNESVWKLFPRSIYEGTCSYFPIHSFSWASPVVIMDCLTDEELHHPDLFDIVPEQSYRSYMFETDSFNPNCTNYYATRPIRLSDCNPQDQYHYTVTQDKYYAYTSRERSTCSGPIDYLYLLRRRPEELETSVFYECTSYLGVDLGGRHMDTYLSFHISDDPYVPSQMANAWTWESEFECGTDLPSTVLRNPDLLSAAYFDPVMFCGNNELGGLRLYYSTVLPEGQFEQIPFGGKSFRGSCSEGKLLLKVFTSSVDCLGDYFEITYDREYCVEFEDMFGDTVFDRLMCFSRYCGEYSELETELVCSGHGKCIGKDVCDCDEGYYGSSCGFFSCFGEEQNVDAVCSGRGECISPDLCSCSSGFSGVECSLSLVVEGFDPVLLVPIFSGVLTPIVILAIIFCCCCCCSIFCLSFFCLCMGCTYDAFRRWREKKPVAPLEEYLTFVFSDIRCSTELWNAFPNEMRKSLVIHDRVLRKCLREHRGFEVKSLGDGIFVCFKEPIDALCWSCKIQKELLKVKWPRRITTSEFCKPVYFEEEENNIGMNGKGRKLMFSGISLRIGIHYGKNFTRLKNRRYKSYDYLGRSINKCSRVESKAKGGFIYCSSTYFKKVSSFLILDEKKYVVKKIKKVRLKGFKGNHTLYSILPYELKERDDENVLRLVFETTGTSDTENIPIEEVEDDDWDEEEDEEEEEEEGEEEEGEEEDGEEKSRIELL